MARLSARFTLGLAVLVWGCGGADDAPPPSTTDATGAGADVPRTGDPATRGLTDADFPRIQELAPGIFSYEQLRVAGEEAFTTVSMFVVTDEGVLVADGQGSIDETERMIARIAEITDRPITHVVVASDHGDHSAGNSAFPENALFYAHPTSAAVLAESAAAASRRPEAARVVVPTELVPDVEVFRLGGTEIQILFLGRAHTGGDLVVYLPQAKIMFMSEAYLNRIFPAMRTAYPSEWVAMIERAQAMDVDTYVPGHGFVESPQVLREELETYREALVAVIAEGRRLHNLGLGLEEAQAQAVFGDLETWTLRSSQGARAIQQVYAELNRELPGAPR